MKGQGRRSLGENRFLFRVLSAVRPEVAFNEKGFSARREPLFATAGISFLPFSSAWEGEEFLVGCTAWPQ